MKKEWFFDRYCGQQFAALVENGKLAEFSVEKEKRGEVVVGNIYKGKVTNVLAGMNAAFVSCGLNRNCYLSMEDNCPDSAKYDGAPTEKRNVKTDLKVGDEIIVQITNLPRGNKGAKVTTHLSFVGRRLIYLPNTDFLGISRKITDETEREKLLKTAEKLRASHDEGFILRTQSPLATPKQLKTEAAYLKNLYTEMLKSAKTAPIGKLLYENDDLPIRTMRDSLGDEIIAIHVGDKELYERLKKLSKLRGDLPEKKLLHYTGERLMMKEYGITRLVQEAIQPVVSLENGGYLVIEHTEAMTVVDVNSGSFVGEKNLEETVFEVNLAAAREIARQVRLRNVGGIIVVDFIDMVNEEHKTAVTEELRAALALDKAKCNVLPMSDLCLTQFTRKRVGSEILSLLVKPCPHCLGKGHLPDDVFVVTRLREAILDCFADGYTAAIVDLNEGIMRKILNEGMFTPETKGRWKDKRIYFVPHKTYKEDCFAVRGETASVLNLPDKAQILY